MQAVVVRSFDEGPPVFAGPSGWVIVAARLRNAQPLPRKTLKT